MNKNRNNNIIKHFFKLTKLRIVMLVGVLLISIFHMISLCRDIPIFFNIITETLLFIKKNQYFDSIISLSIGTIGLVLTLISIFGVGVSKAILTMEKNNINQYLNYIFDLIILSILTIFLSIYLKNTLNLENGSKFITTLNLIYVLILVATIIHLIIIVFLTFLMYAINLLDYENQEIINSKKEQEYALFVSDTLKEVSKSIGNLEKKIESIDSNLKNKDKNKL